MKGKLTFEIFPKKQLSPPLLLHPSGGGVRVGDFPIELARQSMVRAHKIFATVVRYRGKPEALSLSTALLLKYNYRQGTDEQMLVAPIKDRM